MTAIWFCFPMYNTHKLMDIMVTIKFSYKQNKQKTHALSNYLIQTRLKHGILKQLILALVY